MAKQGGGDTTGTVQRVIEVIRYMGEHGETTIKDISNSTGLPPSTCHRLLDLLAKEGLVERDEATREYHIGTELFRIAGRVQAHFEIGKHARPHLEKIAAACDETSVLGLRLPADGKMIFAEKVDSQRLLRYQLNLNEQLSLVWGASGKAILAYLPENEIEQIYEAEDVAPASQAQKPSLPELMEELGRIRAVGFAASEGEKIGGAVGIAAPVFRAGGDVIGCLAITVPKDRIGPRDIQKLGELVRTSANDLSTELGLSMVPEQRKAAK